jgi:hypothetical protein
MCAWIYVRIFFNFKHPVGKNVLLRLTNVSEIWIMKYERKGTEAARIRIHRPSLGATSRNTIPH